MHDMRAANDPPGGERERRALAAARDAGVFRIRRLTRWTATGALALTGVCAGLAAHATASAKHRASRSAGTTSRAQAETQQAPSGTEQDPYTDGEGYGGGYGYDDGSGSEGSYGSGSAAPQAPQQAPQQSTSPPAASTGAS